MGLGFIARRRLGAERSSAKKTRRVALPLSEARGERGRAPGARGPYLHHQRSFGRFQSIETTAAALRFGIPAEEWNQFGMEL